MVCFHKPFASARNLKAGLVVSRTGSCRHQAVQPFLFVLPHPPGTRSTTIHTWARSSHHTHQKRHLSCSTTRLDEPTHRPQQQQDEQHNPRNLGLNQTTEMSKISTPLLGILRRTTFVYLLSVSLCLAWSAAQGWYLILKGRGEEVDDRTPLRIAWDATCWPIDACRRLLGGK